MCVCVCVCVCVVVVVVALISFVVCSLSFILYSLSFHSCFPKTEFHDPCRYRHAHVKDSTSAQVGRAENSELPILFKNLSPFERWQMIG